jgi:tRNA threonylcarbamoyladenosine biosynthesis protein TsaB
MMRLPEGPLLALDASTATGSVAIGHAGRLLVEVVLGTPGQHSTALMPALDSAMRWAGLAPADLAGVVVAGGPGSFTGLRISAASAKGIVHALGLPLWAYSGLMAAAAGLAPPLAGERTVCALFDARGRDVYAAAYRFAAVTGGFEVDELFPPEALPLDDLLARFETRFPPIFTGDGALRHRSEIEAALQTLVPPQHLALPRASSLLWLAAVAPELGWVSDPAAWEPTYVRASGAERIAAKRESGL